MRRRSRRRQSEPIPTQFNQRRYEPAIDTNGVENGVAPIEIASMRRLKRAS